MEGPLGRLVTYCDMVGKSSILVGTLEMRRLRKAQRREATYLTSHSQRARGSPKVVTYPPVTAITLL